MTVPRHRLLTVLAAGLALLSFIGGGGIDLASPWILHEGTQVSEVGYGTLAGLVIPIGLLAQVLSPRRHPAGLQQVAAAAVALLATGALAREAPLVVAAAIVGSAAAVVALFHPCRGVLLQLPERLSLPLLLLALAACVPGSRYALHMAANQRDRLPPADAHLGLQHWAALTAATFAVLLTALLGALRTRGFAVPAFTAAASVCAWGLTCLAYPDSAGAVGTPWAVLGIVWGIGYAVVALRLAEDRGSAPGASAVPARDRRSSAHGTPGSPASSTSPKRGEPMFHAGDQIENPVTGERLVFHETAAETGGERVVFETIVRPEGFVAAAHVHPFQTECFQVLAGSMGIRRGRITAELQAGETAVIDPGTPHKFWNAGDEELRFICTVTPALQFERLIATMYTLAAAGKTNRKGMPSPLRLAVIANHHFDDVRLPLIPQPLQKLGLVLGAPAGRLVGFGPTFDRSPTELEPAFA